MSFGVYDALKECRIYDSREVEALRADLAAERARADKAEAAGVGYSQQTVDALTKERDTLQFNCNEYERRATDAETLVAELLADRDRLRAEVAALAAKDAKDAEIATLECRAGFALVRAVTAEARAERAEQEAAALRAELIRANLKCFELREAWNELSAIIDTACAELKGEKEKPIPAARAGGKP